MSTTPLAKVTKRWKVKVTIRFTTVRSPHTNASTRMVFHSSMRARLLCEPDTGLRLSLFIWQNNANLMGSRSSISGYMLWNMRFLSMPCSQWILMEKSAIWQEQTDFIADIEFYFRSKASMFISQKPKLPYLSHNRWSCANTQEFPIFCIPPFGTVQLLKMKYKIAMAMKIRESVLIRRRSHGEDPVWQPKQ